MVYRVSDIRRRVRIALDENSGANALISNGDNDTLELDEIIDARLEEAARQVLSAVPGEALEGGHLLRGALFRDNKGGWMPLPENYLRLIRLRLSDWERPVHEALSVSDPRYAQQSSRFGGIRGCRQNPLVFEVLRGSGPALELYPCSADSELSDAIYAPVPTIDSDGGIDLPWRCLNAVVNMTAALVALTYGDSDKYQRLQAIATV